MRTLLITIILSLFFIKPGYLHSNDSVKIKKMSSVPPIIITNGSRRSKKVALTIDDGWAMDNELLAVLEKYKIRCTVFIVGEVARKRPAWVKKMYNMGFEICNHTYSHRWLTTLSDKRVIEEIRKGQYYITKITGKVYPFFRPPARMINARILRLIANEGYYVILWDNDVLGYNKEMSIETQLRYVRKKMKNGNIILSHFGRTLKTARVLEIIIPEMLGKGYKFVTISELMKYRLKNNKIRIAKKRNKYIHKFFQPGK